MSREAEKLVKTDGSCFRSQEWVTSMCFKPMNRKAHRGGPFS